MADTRAVGPDLEVVRAEDTDPRGPRPDAEPEEFGLRIVFQTESEQLEAAEFLVATRMQEDVRRRSAAAALAVREQVETDLKAALHHRPAG